MNTKIIYNKRSNWKTFMDQFGEIIGLETGLIICSFFFELKWIIVGQFFLIPIFIILILSKYSKSIDKVLINRTENIFQFHLSNFLKSEKIVVIPFEHIKIDRKFKWILNYYTEIIEIKEVDKNRIIIPINKSNSEFIREYLAEIEFLSKDELIEKPRYIKH